KYAEAYNHLGRLLLEQNSPDEASEVLKKSVILAPGLLPALVDLADALVRISRHRAALPLLARAEKIDPKSVPVHVAIANANIRAHDAEKANAAFEKAIDLSATPLPANARTAYAMTKSRLGDDQAAYAVLAEVLSETPDFAPALGGMGELLQTLGRFDEAMASFEKSMELAPNRGDVYRMYVAGKKISSDDPILPRMIEIYDTEKLEDTDRMHLAFAIAKSQEDIKDYTRSFEYLDAANALVRKSNPHSMNARKREILRYKEAYGDFDYRGAKTPGATEYAPIFVTGMPRSGTTLVEQIISSHSTVTGAGEIASAAKAIQSLLAHKNEVRKLSNVPLTEFSELGRALEAHLRTRFPDTPHITDKAILTYMHIGPIKLAMPKARFVLVRRDPRDNLLSIYKNKFPDGTHLYAYDQLDLVQYYSTFVEMVNFWRELVPDWFYEVQYEELVANPEEETRKLIAACGLEWEDSCLDFHENKRKVQTLSVFQARQPISKGSVKSWQRYEKELKPMLDALREAGHVTD
ncbi:MAG: sulfotransferase, partial [Albidovulum sp.]